MLRKELVLLALISGPVAYAQQSSPRVPNYVTGNTDIPSYSVSTSFSNSAASAGDLFCLYGSATNVIRIKGVRVTGVASAAATVSAALIRRTTLYTVGSSTANVITPVASDSANPASTVTAVSFSGTALPTPGATTAQGGSQPGGNVRNRYISLPVAAGSATGPSEGLFQFSVYWDQPQVLRKPTEGLCWNASANGNSWAIDYEYTETPQ